MPHPTTPESSAQLVKLTAELRALAARQRARDAADRAALAAKVAELRAAGATWQHIGDALGVRRTAAQKRFGKAVT